MEEKLTYGEAWAYLEIADWDMECAIQNVLDDFVWEERSMPAAEPFRIDGRLGCFV